MIIILMGMVGVGITLHAKPLPPSLTKSVDAEHGTATRLCGHIVLKGLIDNERTNH